MAESIFIYCDDPAHPRRVAVTNFDRINGQWHERPASRAGKTAGTGVTLVRDAVPEPGWALDDGISNSETRPKLDLRCRKCRRRARPVPVRPENLYPVLDYMLGAGVSEAPLSLVAAILQGRSEA